MHITIEDCIQIFDPTKIPAPPAPDNEALQSEVEKSRVEKSK